MKSIHILIVCGKRLGFLKETNTKSLKVSRASKIMHVDFP